MLRRSPRARCKTDDRPHRRVVADALNNGAAVDVTALERSKIDGAPSPHIDRFGRDGRGEKAQEKCGGGSDHDVREVKA